MAFWSTSNPSALSRSAMSAVVTDPNSLSPSPAFIVKVSDTASSRAATCCAVPTSAAWRLAFWPCSASSRRRLASLAG